MKRALGVKGKSRRPRAFPGVRLGEDIYPEEGLSMIRELARCPYCQGCEVALDDQVALVFDPEAPTHEPCPHLAWVDGRYSEWGPGTHGTSHLVGSTEFRWDPPEPDAEERTHRLLSYLRELLPSGAGWAFAPAVPFEIRTLSAEESTTTPEGKTQLLWDVDGWAVFAENPAAFWSALPECQERHQESLDMGGEFAF
jgi:hypothetical protein